jgi:effector-binding domain-containing protein
LPDFTVAGIRFKGKYDQVGRYFGPLMKRAVTLIHQGPYDTKSESYRKIGEYMKECGLKAGIPSRELYLKGPGMIFAGNPKKYLTEIQVIGVKE